MNARFAALLRAELHRLWKQPRLRWLALIAPVTIALLAGALHDAATVAGQRQDFTSAERARWLAQGEKDPHSAAHFGVWAVKPVSPLSVLTPGIEPFVGLAVWLEAHKRNEMIFRPRQDADPVMRGASSAGHILELLGPLVALLLGFASFAHERERGTLRMALANGATSGRILLVRLTVTSFLMLGILILPALGGGILALLALPGGTMWQGAARLALWTTLHIVYLETYLLLALAISLRAPSARTALAILLALWFALCIVLPRLASSSAEMLAPIPSYKTVRLAVEAQAPAYENAERWDARREALLVANSQAARQNMRAAQLDQAERDSHVVFDRLLGSFYDAITHQDQVFTRFAVLTPTVALQAGAAGMAGTDFRQHRHFIDAAEHYRRQLVNQLNDDLMGHQDGADAAATTGRAYWAGIGAFDYRAPPLAGVLQQLALPLLMLLLWAGAAALAACQATRRVTA